jgi:RHS repeat-associated protein
LYCQAAKGKKPMDTVGQLSENTRQGFDGLQAAICLASMEANSNTASGFTASFMTETRPIPLFTDMLGSVRTITNASGGIDECYDYLPFGRILSSSDNGRSAAKNALGGNCHPANPNNLSASKVDEKFTGQPRDNETGLDYFGARYFSAPLGRFTSPDPIWVTADRMLDPQRLNLYSYVRNNPLKYNDPTGLELQIGDCGNGYPASWCYELLKRGLSPDDRDAVSLIKGTGDNNCSKGALCVSVDSKHTSKSENFEALQYVANAKDIAILEGKGPNDNVSSFAFSVISIEKQFPDVVGPITMGVNSGLLGATLFPLYDLPGSEHYNTLFSRGINTHLVFAHDMLVEEIIKTMHHEIRHIYLGDFGRDLLKGTHPYGDIPTRNAQEEAGMNMLK